MPAPQPVTRREFLTHLKRSGLLTPEQYAAVNQEVAETDRGRILARSLVARGLLTKFQAERLLIGRTAGFYLDQYVILEELGRGGMGRVYKARHLTMNRAVALKVLAPDLTASDRAQQMFLREVQALASLVHPNIVTAYDANKVGDRYYLVMEFVDGPNLHQLVKASGPLEPGRACDYIRQAAQGLQAAHSSGMIHRDIKPANILVQRRALDGSPGLVKITDFSLARLADSGAGVNTSNTILTRPNTVMGTPDFLSPEQARSLHRVDHRTDLYSLGATFYFLLTGHVPFPGGTAMEKLIRHTSDEPLAIEALRPEVPAPVIDIVSKLMAKKPDNRFQSCAEIVAALEPFSVSGPTLWEQVRPAADLSPDLGTSPNLDGSDPVMEAQQGTLPAVGFTPLADSSGSLLFTPEPRPARASRRGNWAPWIFALACLGLLGLAVGAYFALAP